MLQELFKTWFFGLLFAAFFTALSSTKKDTVERIAFKVLCWPLALLITCARGCYHHLRG